MQPIPLADLVILEPAPGLTIDLVYAQADHPENMFKTAFYRADAPFILHRRLAEMVKIAARTLNEAEGWTLVLKDGLRPVEAQEAVFGTPLIKAHPEWVTPPRNMFAAPGGGGHPRGMAVDVGVRGRDGKDLDFGTIFDAMPDLVTGKNPAHRNFMDFDGGPGRVAQILSCRQVLTQSFLDAAVDCGEALWPLPHEWWDYRLPPHIYNTFAPIQDADLPADMHLLPR